MGEPSPSSLVLPRSHPVSSLVPQELGSHLRAVRITEIQESVADMIAQRLEVL